MRKQSGSIILALMIVLGLIGTVVGVAIVSYVSNANYGNEAEQRIDASYDNNRAILGQVSLKVREVAQVSDKYKDALVDVVEQAMSGRYGDDGSGAVFQWITEQNPQVDSAVYMKVAQVIESGRNEFMVAQTMLKDQCRVYQTNLGYLYKGFWLRLAGYPKAGLDKKCTLITSEHAREAYETGIDTGFSL